MTARLRHERSTLIWLLNRLVGMEIFFHPALFGKFLTGKVNFLHIIFSTKYGIVNQKPGATEESCLFTQNVLKSLGLKHVLSFLIQKFSS